VTVFVVVVVVVAVTFLPASCFFVSGDLVGTNFFPSSFFGSLEAAS